MNNNLLQGGFNATPYQQALQQFLSEWAKRSPLIQNNLDTSKPQNPIGRISEGYDNPFTSKRFNPLIPNQSVGL